MLKKSALEKLVSGYMKEFKIKELSFEMLLYSILKDEEIRLFLHKRKVDLSIIDYLILPIKNKSGKKVANKSVNKAVRFLQELENDMTLNFLIEKLMTIPSLCKVLLISGYTDIIEPYLYYPKTASRSFSKKYISNILKKMKLGNIILSFFEGEEPEDLISAINSKGIIPKFDIVKVIQTYTIDKSLLILESVLNSQYSTIYIPNYYLLIELLSIPSLKVISEYLFVYFFPQKKIISTIYKEYLESVTIKKILSDGFFIFNIERCSSKDALIIERDVISCLSDLANIKHKEINVNESFGITALEKYLLPPLYTELKAILYFDSIYRSKALGKFFIHNQMIITDKVRTSFGNYENKSTIFLNDIDTFSLSDDLSYVSKKYYGVGKFYQLDANEFSTINRISQSYSLLEKFIEIFSGGIIIIVNYNLLSNPHRDLILRLEDFIANYNYLIFVVSARIQAQDELNI